MKADEIRQCLNDYDDGLFTETGLELRLFDKIMEEKLVHLRKNEGPNIHFYGGAFCGPLRHDYGLFDINSQTTAFYSFTFLNVLRLLWNKSMRKLNLHQWTKVW